MTDRFFKLSIYGIGFLYFALSAVAFAAPTYVQQRTILPETNNTYELGTTTKKWFRIVGTYSSSTQITATSICLTGDTCRTTWPAGGASSASTTLLSDQNTFTALNAFSNATTTLLSGSTAWFTSFVGALTGNASTATALQNSRTINGVSFDGTANIVVSSTTLLANNNTWTGLNTFSNSTSTLFTSTTAWIGTLNLTTALTIANGGTGLSTIGASSTVLVSNASAAKWQQIDLAATVYGRLPFANLAQVSANSVLGNITSATANATSIATSSLFNTAAAGVTGLLSGTDWSTFNNKGSGTVTSVATTWPISGGTFTTSGTIAWTGLSTSSSLTAGRVHVTTGGGGTFADIATSSIAFSGPFSGVSSLGNLVGGSNTTVNWTGLSTTSQPSSSNLLVSNGGAGVYGVATTAVSCSGNVSCTAFTALGAASTISFTGTLATTNGGTGTTTWQTNSIPYFDGTRMVENNSNFSWTNTGTRLLATNASTTNFTAGTFAGLPTSASCGGFALGSFCLDTTDNQIQVGTSTSVQPAVFSSYKRWATGVSTTTWAGTTTVNRLETNFAGYIKSGVCETDAGTLNAQLKVNSTNLTMFNASTTANKNTFNTNNTFVSGDTIKLDFGTPASSPTFIDCTFDLVENAT